jgi:hypothetical protein
VGATETQALSNGYRACQIVKPGGEAQFLMKDGAGGCGASTKVLFGGDDTEASCTGLPNNTPTSSCTGNKNAECVWSITVPDSDSCVTVVSDDPPITVSEEEEFLCA